MKEFNIRFEGKWFFDYTYSANSKEEALENALQNVCDEAYPFDLVILEQYVDEEKIDRPEEIVEWSITGPNPNIHSGPLFGGQVTCKRMSALGRLWTYTESI